MAQRHDAQGWWQAEAGPVEPLAPLEAELNADVVIVGGGYSGMWSAWICKQLAPEAEVVLVEREVCGCGPSGRNGGFVNEMWFSLPTLRERFGDGPAVAIAQASTEAVAGIGRFCAEQDVDAWFRPGGYLQVSTTSAHDDATDEILFAVRELGQEGACIPQTAAQVAARCASPAFRGGAFFPGAATVQPARLARALRDRLVASGVRIFERSPMRRIRDTEQGVEVATVAGRVRARSAVLAAGPWLSRLRPVRRRMTLTTSHMVITEPVPDVIEEIGWTGGECITDSRVMLHYFRTTPDGRIAFGWGGGPVVPGSRLGDRADLAPSVITEIERHLVRFFPALDGRVIEHAWGGPIDVSPTHVPSIVSLPGGRGFAAFGYTGNGVGPTHLFGQILARLALDRRDELTALPIVDPPPSWRVPPEPFRYAGGTVIRRALIRKETAEELGREPGPVTSFVADFPHRIGIHVGR